MMSMYNHNELRNVFERFPLNRESINRIFSLLEKAYRKEAGIFESNNESWKEFEKIIDETCDKIDIPNFEVHNPSSHIRLYVKKCFIEGYLLSKELQENNYLKEIIKRLDERFSDFLLGPKRNGKTKDGLRLEMYRDFKDYLKYLIENDNYLNIAPVVKILSEYMDLPLKGKSLGEYKKAIVETCKEMIKEEEKKEEESREGENENK